MVQKRRKQSLNLKVVGGFSLSGFVLICKINMSFLSKVNDKIFNKESPLLKEAQGIVLEINKFEADFNVLKDEEFSLKTAEFKKRISDGANLNDILPEAFALVREAAKRTLGQRHYDVQLLGGIVMHKGGISEMKTGEGKTLVATLPAYLNALSGKGVHVVTVNDYLSRRDAVWMGQIYYALGLSVGCINHESSFLYDPTHEKNELDKERDEREVSRSCMNF